MKVEIRNCDQNTKYFVDKLKDLIDALDDNITDLEASPLINDYFSSDCRRLLDGMRKLTKDITTIDVHIIQLDGDAPIVKDFIKHLQEGEKKDEPTN